MNFQQVGTLDLTGLKQPENIFEIQLSKEQYECLVNNNAEEELQKLFPYLRFVDLFEIPYKMSEEETAKLMSMTDPYNGPSEEQLSGEPDGFSLTLQFEYQQDSPANKKKVKAALEEMCQKP